MSKFKPFRVKDRFYWPSEIKINGQTVEIDIGKQVKAVLAKFCESIEIEFLHDLECGELGKRLSGVPGIILWSKNEGICWTEDPIAGPFSLYDIAKNAYCDDYRYEHVAPQNHMHDVADALEKIASSIRPSEPRVSEDNVNLLYREFQEEKNAAYNAMRQKNLKQHRKHTVSQLDISECSDGRYRMTFDDLPATTICQVNFENVSWPDKKSAESALAVFIETGEILAASHD